MAIKKGSYLPNLLGALTIKGDGVPLERRTSINFVGATITDDGEETRIELPAGGAPGTFTVTMGPGGGLKGQYVVSALDALEPSRALVATAANVAAAGGLVWGMLLEDVAEDAEGEIAGNGYQGTVPRSINGLPTAAASTAVRLDTVTGYGERWTASEVPPPTSLVLGVADPDGNQAIGIVTPGPASWVDNLSLVSPLDYGADPTGATSEPAATETLDAIDDALADAAATGKEFLVPAGVLYFKSSRTISIPVRFVGRIKVATGQTVTFAAAVHAPRRQVFENCLAGQGTVAFSSKACAEYACPEWWGASAAGRVLNGTTTANTTCMTNGSPIVRVTGGLTAADVGSICVVYEQTGLFAFRSTIASYASATQCSLAANADKNIAGGTRTINVSTTADVNSGTDEIAETAHTLNTGDPVTYTKVGSQDIGLTTATVYWARSTGANTFTLHPTRADSLAGTNAKNLTAGGAETHTLVSANKGTQVWIGPDSGDALIAAFASGLPVSLAPSATYGSTKKINPATGGAITNGVRLRGHNAVCKYVGAASAGHFFSTDPGTDTGTTVGGTSRIEHVTFDASKLLDDAVYMANESYPIRGCGIGGTWDTVSGVNALRFGQYHHAAQSSQFDYCRSQYTGGDGMTFVACNASRLDHPIAGNTLGDDADGIRCDSYSSAGGGNSYGGGDLTILGMTSEVISGYGLVVEDTGQLSTGGNGSGSVVRVIGGHIEGASKSGIYCARKGTEIDGLSISNGAGFYAVELLPFAGGSRVRGILGSAANKIHAGCQNPDVQEVYNVTTSSYIANVIAAKWAAPLQFDRANGSLHVQQSIGVGTTTPRAALDIRDGSILGDRGVLRVHGVSTPWGGIGEAVNLLKQSRARGTTPWTTNKGTATTITNNAAIAADGKAVASRVEFRAGSSAQWFSWQEGDPQTYRGFLAISDPDTFTASGDTLTVARDLPNLTKVQVGNSGGALPTGLAASTDYWWVRLSATTGKLGSTPANAAAGTAVTLSSAGTGTHYITPGRAYCYAETLQAAGLDTLLQPFVASGLTFDTGSAINSGTDVVTITAHGLATGDAVIYTKVGSQNIGLTHGSTYYVRAITADTFTVHASKTNACQNLSILNLTAGGSETHIFGSTTKLVDASLGAYVDGVTPAGFVSMGVQPGDEIRNVTEGTTALVVSVDSETQLTTATPKGQTAVVDWAGDVYIPPQRVGLTLSNGNSTTIATTPSFAVDWQWRQYWIAGVTYYLADLTKKPRCNLLAATGGVPAVVHADSHQLSLPVAGGRLEPGPTVHTTTLPLATARIGAPLNADHGGAPSLDAPGFWMRIPITKDTADAATLYAVPADVRGLLVHRIFWEITATAWTGGSSSAIGISSDDATYNTKGDLLGGATGDVAATLTANKFTGGTLGTKFGSNGVVVIAGGKVIRFDRITSAFTAGTGYVWLYCSVLQ